jgi:predicted CXXCH cytochrome family protein
MSREVVHMRNAAIAGILFLFLGVGLAQAAPFTNDECLGCHDTVSAAKFAQSVHGKLVCTNCHSDITTAPHETKPKAVDCSPCHEPAVTAWRGSVHFKGLKQGQHGPGCVDCHGSAHTIVLGSDPQSPISKFNVSNTCGKCHPVTAIQYRNGLHGTALAKGNWMAPVCGDCHGIHAISRVSDTDRGPRASCAHCHESVRLTQDFAIPVERVGSYATSYHGLARQMGSKTAADCASCHGAHEILPSSDPQSPTNKKNLPVTCGKCHKGAQADFAKGNVHVTGGIHGDVPTKVITWIKWIYIAAILGAAWFMLSHNFLVWFYKVRQRRKNSKRTVVRMNKNQRIQHCIMFTTFFILVLSGFALIWPNSWLGMAFVTEAVRRWVHRIAAIGMILLGIYHVGYMVGTKEGRKGLLDFFPRFSDITDVFRVYFFYLGWSDKKPEFRRFGYAEKLEYWAGMWGTIVMAVTGLVIWFSVTVTTWIPRWWVDVATVIHLFEAVLATMSILIWHLYHVIFDPDVYPMNFAWIDGKMSEELYHHEHGLDPNPPKEE